MWFIEVDGGLWGFRDLGLQLGLQLLDVEVIICVSRRPSWGSQVRVGPKGDEAQGLVFGIWGLGLGVSG